jgi:hypothetical protein
VNAGPNQFDQQALDRLSGVGVNAGPNQFDQQARDQLMGIGINREFDPQTVRAREMMMQSLEGLQGPDRMQLALDGYNLFRDRTQDQYNMDMRDVGKKAAALGRVGAGMTTNDLTGVMGQRQKELNMLERDLTLQAAQQTLGDRQSILQSQLGAAGMFDDQSFRRDAANADIGMNRANMLAGMGRDQFGREATGANLGMAQANMLAGMGQNQFGREATGANIGMTQAGMLAGMGQDQFGREMGGANLGMAQAGMLAGMGQDQFGREMGGANLGMAQAGMLAGMGQDQFGREMGGANLGLNRAGMLAGMGQNQFGREVTGYNQQVGERGYQDNLAQQALQARVAQWEREQAAAQAEWQREYDENRLRAQLAGGYGSPTSVLTGYPGATGASSFDFGQFAGGTPPTSRRY